MNKEAITKYMSKWTEQECIEFILTLSKSLKSKYNAREKSSTRTLEETRAYTWIRWGGRSNIEAKHTRNCEIYDEVKKELQYVVNEFIRLK